MMAEIHHLHRQQGVRGDDPRSFRPDLLKALARSERRLRIRSTFRDRFCATVNELKHDPVFTHWLAAVAGVFLTVLSAIFWGWVL